MKKPAFTFIEVLVVTIIIAILSMAVALSFQGTRDKIAFDNTKNEMVSFVQKARSLSLANLLIEDTYPTEYYKLTINEDGMEIVAYGESGTVSESIDTLELTEGHGIYPYSADVGMPIYYFPPFGDICLTDELSDCDTAGTTREFMLYNAEGTREVEFVISTTGGYLEELE